MSAKISERVRAILTACRGATRQRRSPTFEAFRRSVLTDRDIARNGLDLASLRGLVGRERGLAERMLIEALPDTRAVIGLGVLGSQRAARRIVAIFERECAAAFVARIGADGGGDAYALIASAQALWRISPHPRYVRVIIGTLEYGRTADDRVDAAAALGDMPTPETEVALSQALDDPDALVRHHAARALLALHGVETDAGAMNHMIYRVMAQDPARQEGGRRDIVDAVARAPSQGHSANVLRYGRGG